MSLPDMSSSDRNYPDRGPVVFAVTTATLALATVFVSARVVCRVWIVRRVTYDDYIIFLAWLIAFFLSFTIDLGVSRGLGRHDENITDDDLPTLRRCEYVFSILYNPALMATKTSILVFYLRLAKNTQVVLKYASWATLIVVNAAGAVLTFMNIFQCSPIAGAWDPNIVHPTCIPLLTEFICAAPVSVVTDLAILALPIPVLTGMRLPSRQKTILVITFTLGIFVSVVDVIRIYYLQQAISSTPTGTTQDSAATFGDSPQFAWTASLSLMWSAVEVNVAISCSCIPLLKPLILKLLPAMLYDPDGTRISARRGTDSSASNRNKNSNRVGRDNADVTKPPPAALPDDHDTDTEVTAGVDAPISAMEFLTTPSGMGGGQLDNIDYENNDLPPIQPLRTHTGATATTGSVQENAVYFGFVNMAKPKSMLKTNSSESLKYCSLVTVLFLLWGISYGLLNTLNNVVAAVNGISTAEAIGLSSAYWGGGYFFGPLLVGEWILRRDEHNRSKRHGRNLAESVGGFKAVFIVGLCIYGIGTIIFWPSAVTNSFGGFMLSNFVVGFGLSVLEVGANAFLILCGPPDYGEFRLLLAQGVQAVGSVLSGLLAQKVFFKSIAETGYSNSMTLINVQWTYLGITLFCVVLALFFFYMPLPEVSDDELDASTRNLPVDPVKRTGFLGLQLRTIALGLAAFTQYLYVGAQESNSIFFSNLIESVMPRKAHTGSEAASGSPASNNGTSRSHGTAISIPDYLLVGHSAFAVSRFLAAYLTYLSAKHPRRFFPQPRTWLTIFVFLCFLFSLIPVVIHPSSPNRMVIPLLLYFFAEGPIYPLVFAIGLRGQGRRTKRAAAFITMGCAGPAFFPFIMYSIIKHGGSVQTAYITIVAMQAASMAYPAFLEASKATRALVDPNPGARQPLRELNDEQATDVRVVARHGDAEKTGWLERLPKSFIPKSLVTGRKSSGQPSVQHEEESDDAVAGIPTSNTANIDTSPNMS